MASAVALLELRRSHRTPTRSAVQSSARPESTALRQFCVEMMRSEPERAADVAERWFTVRD